MMSKTYSILCFGILCCHTYSISAQIPSHMRMRGSSFLIDSALAVGTGENHIVDFTGSYSNGRFFVIWTDLQVGQDSINEVHGVHCDADGRILDSANIVKNLLPDHIVGNLNAVQTPQQTLIAWHYTPYPQSRPATLRARRMTPAGEFIDNSDIVITQNLNYAPTVCAGDSVYLFAWNGYGDKTYIIRLSKSGRLLDTAPIVLRSIQELPGFIGIIHTTPYFMVFTGTTGHIDTLAMQRVGEDGRIVDTTPIFLAGNIYIDNERVHTATIHAGDSGCLIAWMQCDTLSERRDDILGFRITFDGRRIDASDRTIDTAQSDKFSLSAVSSGASYRVLWIADSSICGATLDAHGAVTPFPQRLEKACTKIRIIKGDTAHLLVYSEKRFKRGGRAVKYVKMQQTGTIPDTTPVLLSICSNKQKAPSIAYNGNHYFIVWEDTRNTVTKLYGKRFDVKGNALDWNSFPVVVSGHDQSESRLAAGSQNYFLGWRYEDDVWLPWYRGALFSLSGSCIHDSIVLDSDVVASDLHIHCQGNRYHCSWLRDSLLLYKSFDQQGALTAGCAVSLVTMGNSRQSNLQTAIGKRSVFSLFRDGST